MSAKIVSKLGQYLSSQGFCVEEMGGGCRAWVRRDPDVEVVITDLGGGDIPDPESTQVMVGTYSLDGECLRCDERSLLTAINASMRAHDQEVAPGSESAQWQAYVADCSERLGCTPWEAADRGILPPEDFAAYWEAVAARDYTTASRYGDVPDAWGPGIDAEVAP